MSFVINDTEWAEDLQKNLSTYMDLLLDSIYDESDEEPFETESGMPYCACNTCEFREILVYVTPRIINAYLEGKVELTDEV